MKKILTLMLVATAFITVSASAQNEMARQKAPVQKQALMDSLKISSEVADSVIAIRMQTMQQMKSIMQDESLSPEQKKEKARPIKEEMRAKIEKYLTKDQIAKLQEMQGSMRKDKGEK